MHVKPQDWLKLIRREYLQDFVRRGGAAVKFPVPMETEARDELRDGLRAVAGEEDFLFVFVDASKTKVHMIDHLFHEVARQVDWDALAYSFVKRILTEKGYRLPQDRAEFNLRQIALLNGYEEMFLRRDLKTWLQEAIFHDYQMSQEFRIAMIRLCLAQLDVTEASSIMTNAVKEWLRGELRLISAVKEALIFQKVARHNARHMLFSLAHWLKLNGKSGLILVLDISRYMVVNRPKEPDGTLYYSKPAAIDAYEVLRQFIDGTDELEGCLIVVLTSPEFLINDQRGLNCYDALRLRISNEIRDRHRQNPLASLIRVSSNDAP